MNTKELTAPDWANIARLAPRFWQRVDIREDSACWEIEGPVTHSGHKVYTSPAGKNAHRYAWALANGRLPASNEVVRHRCDNPPCVNPTHLVIGTQAENVADMIRRGRAPYSATTCRNGHTRTPANTATLKSGVQRCLVCQRESSKTKHARTGRFECPECCELIAKGNMKRHRQVHHAITESMHVEWLESVKGKQGAPLLRARAATIADVTP